MSNEISWSIDPSHSDIAFMVKHLMIAHAKGSFKSFEANIITTDKDFTTAVIDLTIDVASISTGDAKRDEHLLGEEFFDVKKHRQINFQSETIGKADAQGNHELWGNLTMKGITKRIMLTVQFGGFIQDPRGNEKAGFTVAGKIQRSNWGLSWNSALEAGGFMISEEVTIACEIELTNQGFKVMTLKPGDKANLKTAL
ncbi:MAG TPA: YceI family protein [Bacteroidia bacterium]|nr:YceI family protein [Bacteroidia bacterium]